MGEVKPDRTLERRSQTATGEAFEAPSGAVAESPTRLGDYLRRLREGYGYTLRKVEQRANALGEAIDNSQLSRFEKGRAVPSFDKLRALGRVFNVPVQNFSDVLDLEEYQHLRPADGDYDALLKEGAEWLSRGEHGQAFVIYERAMEVAETAGDSELATERVAEARWRMAMALKSLGKLYMTERELRAILKQRNKLLPRTRLRVLLQLSYLYRELGDLYLAGVLAKECLDLATAEADLLTQAGVLNTLGNIEHDEERPEVAVEHYRQALQVLEGISGHHEMMATLLTNLGGCLISLDRFDEGVAMLREAHTRARDGRLRRVAALSLTRLAEAYERRGQFEQARDTLSESETLASRGGDCYQDILFLNTFRRWIMARKEEHGTRERIAFGRLRHLRASLQRRFAEVDEFDRYIEGAKR